MPARKGFFHVHQPAPDPDLQLGRPAASRKRQDVVVDRLRLRRCHEGQIGPVDRLLPVWWQLGELPHRHAAPEGQDRGMALFASHAAQAPVLPFVWQAIGADTVDLDLCGYAAALSNSAPPAIMGNSMAAMLCAVDPGIALAIRRTWPRSIRSKASKSSEPIGMTSIRTR